MIHTHKKYYVKNPKLFANSLLMVTSIWKVHFIRLSVRKMRIASQRLIIYEIFINVLWKRFKSKMKMKNDNTKIMNRSRFIARDISFIYLHVKFIHTFCIHNNYDSFVSTYLLCVPNKVNQTIIFSPHQIISIRFIQIYFVPFELVL